MIVSLLSISVMPLIMMTRLNGILVFFYRNSSNAISGQVLYVLACKSCLAREL